MSSEPVATLSFAPSIFLVDAKNSCPLAGDAQADMASQITKELLPDDLYAFVHRWLSQRAASAALASLRFQEPERRSKWRICEPEIIRLFLQLLMQQLSAAHANLPLELSVDGMLQLVLWHSLNSTRG